MRLLNTFRAAFAALALLGLAVLPAAPQTVTPAPTYVDNSQNVVTDLGNGPTEIKMVTGSAQLFTRQGSGVGSTSGSSTNLTLTAVPTVTPCVGCNISGTGVTSGTTVTAFNGTTSITLSTTLTIASGTALAWGSACPTTMAGVTNLLLAQAGVGGDLPFYTQARVCAAGQFAAGASLLQFPIGAH